ncbi:Metallo-dependent phosphatase [Aaosphaeria arxii CBS 175.79]|uniref:Metallo-dependent phosphatase n=1 Tax=Aaosphaeria arxii CBS 175.79 TaxID=1450172 RepID=A0A6A5X8N2_9PLEO|nr:Metallo-dependent phosphatase [Aaosphaeria arxii CBS 175.79]KAF2009167.1 Metallo-dependent phosphatase [Aaosphaeria arxii CBS 175.79]
MAEDSQAVPQTRKTRIVCISDTHNQTPKLPKGDVLIHAGDLTNQGSYSELKKTINWIEKTDFEAKIVIAGNHDITLDPSLFAQHGTLWRWPAPQDPHECRKLLTGSSSITYLENQAATVHLRSPQGPRTCFKVFGSPCTPKMKNHWAFQYAAEDAPKIWDAIPLDTDIVITHTPPKGHVDKAEEDDRSGCAALTQALHRVRPMMSVCGHIHGGRGVERVRWGSRTCCTPGDCNGCLVEAVESWRDPGVGSNKQSLVNCSSRGGRVLDNVGCLAGQAKVDGLAAGGNGGQAGETGGGGGRLVGGAVDSTSHTHLCPPGGVSSNKEALFVDMLGGAISVNDDAALTTAAATTMADNDVGVAATLDVDGLEWMAARRETVIINAAYMGPRRRDVPKTFNKPIVVDVDLPVW